MPKTNLCAEVAREIRAQRFDITPEGVYFPRLGAIAAGEYFGRVNGGAWGKEGDNLIVTEGFAHMLNSTFDKSTAKAAGHYLAIFSGGTAPAANWTAQSFAAVSSEITSMTEGHTGATRPVLHAL